MNRFWVYQNKYHLLVLEGNTVAPKRHLLGNNGLVEIDDTNVKDLDAGKGVESFWQTSMCIIQIDF